MKRCILVIFIAIAGGMLSGCDFFRSLAGRPTSAAIEQKRQQIVEEQEAAMRRQAEAERREADSLAAVEALSGMDRAMTEISSVRGGQATDMKYRYYIIVGSFQSRDNAERQLRKARDSGFDGAIIQYRRSLNTVGICPSDDIVETYKNLQAVRRNGFCPEAWILVNE